MASEMKVKSNPITFLVPKFEDNAPLNTALTFLFKNKFPILSDQIIALKTVLLSSEPRTLLEMAVEKIVTRACKQNNSLEPLFLDKGLPPLIQGIALKTLFMLRGSPVSDIKRFGAEKALHEFRSRVKELEEFRGLMSPFSSQEMPDGDSCGIYYMYWLYVYWEKLGQERGSPLTDQEKWLNLPERASYKAMKMHHSKF